MGVCTSFIGLGVTCRVVGFIFYSVDSVYTQVSMYDSSTFTNCLVLSDFCCCPSADCVMDSDCGLNLHFLGTFFMLMDYFQKNFLKYLFKSFAGFSIDLCVLEICKH